MRVSGCSLDLRSMAKGPTRSERYVSPPTKIGNQYCAIRYVSTPTVAALLVNPKPTNVGMYIPSTMPRPPGVIGTTAMMLASPNATINKSRLTLPPNARRNTHSAAASSSQFSAAHPSTRNNNFGSAARPCSRLPKC